MGGGGVIKGDLPYTHLLGISSTTNGANMFGYSNGKDTKYLPDVMGSLTPEDLDFLFYYDDNVGPEMGDWLVFPGHDQQDLPFSYFGINGIYQVLSHSGRDDFDISLYNSIIDIIMANCRTGNPVPIWLSKDEPPQPWVDIGTFDLDRDDTYKLEISYDVPCGYIKVTNVTPDSRTGSYINYSLTKVSDLTYHVEFEQVGIPFSYVNYFPILLSFDPTGDLGLSSNLCSVLNSLSDTDSDQFITQSAFFVDAQLRCFGKTPFRISYDRTVDVPLDMTMYKDILDTQNVCQYLGLDLSSVIG